MPERYEEPVKIGQAIIHTGDWIIGDRDGVISIPGDDILPILEETERVMHTESMVRKANKTKAKKRKAPARKTTGKKPGLLRRLSKLLVLLLRSMLV